MNFFIETIQRQGRLTFAQFMQLLLYTPEYGYYARKESPIGKQGDFITSVSVSPLFGQILVQHFLEIYQQMGCPKDFTVYELGGHRGALRQDILTYFPNINYQVIEEGDTLPENIVGIIFSNEFFDALPVHRVKVINGCWQEIYVTVKNGELQEEYDILSDIRLAEFLQPFPVKHMEGYTTEVHLAAHTVMQNIATHLQRGYVISIDYGFEFNDYYSPHRPQGTLRCFYQHQQNTEFYQRLGMQDITADVEFSSLITMGERHGLITEQFSTQEKYLFNYGKEVLLKANPRSVQQLLHPALMGRVFKVLVQKRAL